MLSRSDNEKLWAFSSAWERGGASLHSLFADPTYDIRYSFVIGTAGLFHKPGSIPLQGFIVPTEVGYGCCYR